MERIESALSFIPSDDRETWIAIGMALKSELGASGFQIWDEWSQSAKNYNKNSALSSWRSFRENGPITIGTLFHEAKENGWRDLSTYERPSAALLEARRRDAEERSRADYQQREKAYQEAANKAAWIIGQCKPEKHAYLDSKGFGETVGSVWWPTEENNLLCIPMRVGPKIVGVQMIDRLGSKKYLQGQKTSGAEFVINNDGRNAHHWFVEGYATGLSLRECLKALNMRYVIHVTFSAGNLVKIASLHESGIVIADNDESKTGENSAKKTGFPYFLPESGDFNDMHKKLGKFQSSQILRRWIEASVSR